MKLGQATVNEKTAKWIIIFLFIALSTPFFLTASAICKTGAETASRVAINVKTTVAVSGGDLVLASVQSSGEILADTDFRVSANVDTLWFQCFASDLYKAGDPLSKYSIPHQDGVLLSVPRAMPLDFGSQFLTYLEEELGATEKLNGFTLYPTETKGWESSERATFTRDITTTFTWAKPNSALPTGTYVGFIKFMAYTFPHY